MFPRLLLFAAGFCLSWGTLEGFYRNRFQNSEVFTNILRRFNRPAGPLGYFNALYMAFTLEEAKQFPDLVGCHRKMRLIKSGNLLSTSSIWNETHINSTIFDDDGYQSEPLFKRNRGRGRNTKRDLSYPVTTITGSCETTVGGITRLCKVCPAITDLGPDKIPRYINELLCKGIEFCGVPGVSGICQNTTLNQDFLTFENIIPQVYSQAIRVCCECSLFP